MIEFIKHRKPEELIPFGYKNLGFFTKNSKEYADTIFTSIKNGVALKILELDQGVYQFFSRV